MVDNCGVVKLADFGASKKMEALMTTTGGYQSLKGTPYWMAPEVLSPLLSLLNNSLYLTRVIGDSSIWIWTSGGYMECRLHRHRDGDGQAALPRIY